MNSEDFIAIFKKTATDMVQLRDRSWKEMSQKIEDILDQSAYPKDSVEREAMRLVLKNCYLVGYNKGAVDASTYMTTAILGSVGKSEADPLSSLASNQLKQKPENN